MRIRMDIRVLLLLGFMFPCLVCAGTVSERNSEPAGSDSPAASGPKAEEIGRLQQDLAASRTEVEVINERNVTLQTRMQELKARIQEMKRQLLDENQLGDDPDSR